MIRSAKVLDIPIVVTEQTRRVMGETCPSLKQHLTPRDKIFEKT